MVLIKQESRPRLLLAWIHGARFIKPSGKNTRFIQSRLFTCNNSIRFSFIHLFFSFICPSVSMEIHVPNPNLKVVKFPTWKMRKNLYKCNFEEMWLRAHQHWMQFSSPTKLNSFKTSFAGSLDLCHLSRDSKGWWYKVKKLNGSC